MPAYFRELYGIFGKVKNSRNFDKYIPEKNRKYSQKNWFLEKKLGIKPKKKIFGPKKIIFRKKIGNKDQKKILAPKN